MDRRLDDTKRSIGVQGLQDHEKKALFAKFQQHGGEVIKEVARPDKTLNRNKTRGALVRNKADLPFRSTADSSERKSSSSRQPQFSSTYNKQSGSSSFHLFERTGLWFRSVMGGVMKSSGGFLSPGFFTFLHSKAQGNLLNLGLLAFPLAHSNPELRVQLRAELAKLGPYHYEYLVRLGNIYEESLFCQLMGAYNPKAPQKIPLKSVKRPICELYKRIYIVRNFTQSALAAVTRALEVHYLMENKERALLARDIQRLKRSMRFIFDDLLEKLHLAVLNVIKRNFDYGHPELERFLGITEEDRIGYITEKIASEPNAAVGTESYEDAPYDSESEDSDSDAEETDAEPEDEAEKAVSNTIYVTELPEHIQAGFEIMQKFDLNEEKMFSGQEAPLALIGRENKMYKTEIFFEILDREYSFVLTSNKIKIALDYQGGERRDGRKLLGDSYFALDETRANIKEFNRVISERDRVEHSPQMTPLQKSQAIHKLELERTRLDNQIRNNFAHVLTGAESALKMLIDDAKEEKHLLQNPDEVLHFVHSGDKKRRLEGRTVIEAIHETYAFVAALRYRLREGDLAWIGAKIEQVISFEAKTAGQDLNQGAAERVPSGAK
jgi:hypothetical protein